MIYQFKTGTRVPAGATPEGVISERDLVQQRQGAATVDNTFTEVEAHPDDFPNIRAFYPANAEEAWQIAAKDAIRKAYKSVVIIRERPEPGRDQPRQVEIRYLHAPPGPSGEREYLTLDIIRQDQKRLADLMKDLESEAGTYYRKFQNVLAEITEAIAGGS